MMSYRAKKTYRDLIDRPVHHGMSRRDFLTRGLATGVMSVVATKFVFGDLIRQAEAAEMTSCPTVSRNPGAIAQIFASGGPTMGARFFSEAQMSAMNQTMAANYGISAQNLMRLGPSGSNLVIDPMSPFGKALLQGPPGYSGGASAWSANVLAKISGGGHLGPFNLDDGAGADTGLLGGMSPFKVSQLSKDLKFGVSNASAIWANGLPASSVPGRATPTDLAKTFSMTPAAGGLMTSDAFVASSDAARSIASALASVFKTQTRKGGEQMLASASCAFYGNASLADPNYGKTLFDPSGISSLTSKVAVSGLSAQEQAQLSAYYQSAMGMVGGVVTQFNGRDYHGQSAANIAAADIEEARAIVMFLAACEAAGAPGAMIYASNGQAIANGIASTSVTIDGVTSTVNAPVAVGDAGGAYNAGLILFYDPKGSPPSSRYTGTIDGSGNAAIDSNVGSSREAFAGLYLSALKWINGGSIPQSALSAIQGSGVASNTGNILVI